LAQGPSLRSGRLFWVSNMKLANEIFFVLVIISGLSTLGVLFAGLVGMARGPADSLERARGSNKLMWWRVRLQFLTIALILCWWMTKS